MRPKGKARMRLSQYITRRQAVQDARRMLERRAWPRLEMSLIVALTGLCGFFASWVMLHAGEARMAVRYPAAVLVAYGCFLLLLWMWLALRSSDLGDVPDPGGLDSGSVGGASKDAGVDFSVGGGDFGGGGASGSWDGAPSGSSTSFEVSSVGDGGIGDAVGEGLSSADELAIPLLILLALATLAIGAVFAAFQVVAVAPSLLAELLVDGVLSYSLFRRLRGRESRYWLSTAVARTAFPFLATAAMLSVAGALMAWHWPGADSIGDVLPARHAATTPR
jgi:hypothetical protein